MARPATSHLGAVQIEVLSILAKLPEGSVASLAEIRPKMKSYHMSMDSTLNGLRGRGLIQREPGAGKWLWSLTPAGRAAIFS
jgi:DNA-binding MarR family transcriptional regulator